MKNKAGVVIVVAGFWINYGWVLSTLQAATSDNVAYSSDQYWIGKGQGDLAKGKVVCQRVSELSARTDLAKQIRVLVKEHMVDRVRERSGRERTGYRIDSRGNCSGIPARCEDHRPPNR